MPPRPPLPLSQLRRTRLPFRSISISISIQPQLLKINPLPKPILNPTGRRTFSSTPSQSTPSWPGSGKSQADLIVEELQELYETATDELEIASESTSSSTIYAASDRESARDALNALTAAYELYTSPELNLDIENSGTRAAVAGGGGGEAEEGGRLVELAFDPEDVSAEVKEEVRRRVGQRVREVKSAVERLEESAKAD